MKMNAIFAHPDILRVDFRVLNLGDSAIYITIQTLTNWLSKNPVKFQE